MAYQAKRKMKLIEEFQLIDENGLIAHTLLVKLDADDMVGKINCKYTDLCKALATTTEMKRKAQSNEEIGNALEILGNAVVQMFEAVFGEEDTKTIVDFYDNRYVEMCNEVVPFITSVVIPQLNKIRKQNRKTILKPYNRRR